MTTFDRFDPFERRIGAAMDDIAGTRQLDYLDDVFRQTARTSQRPRWSFLERWFNVDTTFARPVVPGRRVPFRMLLLLVVLAAMLGSAAFYVGSQNKLPAPYGPANNGQIVFGMDSDLYVVDGLTGQPRLLLSAEGVQGGVAYSPDGTVIAYDNVVSGADHIWVVNRDGTNPRQVMERAYNGISFAWSPDSRLMAATTSTAGPHELWIAPTDGSGATLLELDDDLVPWDAQWDPLRPNVLLVRAEDPRSKVVDLYFVDMQGTVLSKLGLQGRMMYGAEYEFAGMAISPDGQTIAYNSVEPDIPGFEHFRAHLVNRDGTNDREVVLPQVIQSPYSQAWPIFSPDGEFIAMESWVTQPDGSAVNQIALARTDGTVPARLVGPSIPGVSMVKTWSPDGTTLLMHGNDIDEVYAIDPVTGSYELLPWKSDFPNWQRVAK